MLDIWKRLNLKNIINDKKNPRLDDLSCSCDFIMEMLILLTVQLKPLKSGILKFMKSFTLKSLSSKP